MQKVLFPLQIPQIQFATKGGGMWLIISTQSDFISSQIKNFNKAALLEYRVV